LVPGRIGAPPGPAPAQGRAGDAQGPPRRSPGHQPAETAAAGAAGPVLGRVVGARGADHHGPDARRGRPRRLLWQRVPATPGSAGGGMHQVAAIGLQGVRSRVKGEIVDAAHVMVKGSTGPKPVIATDLMYDVPCEQLADALTPLVKHLPRK